MRLKIGMAANHVETWERHSRQRNKGVGQKQDNRKEARGLNGVSKKESCK